MIYAHVASAAPAAELANHCGEPVTASFERDHGRNALFIDRHGSPHRRFSCAIRCRRPKVRARQPPGHPPRRRGAGRGHSFSDALAPDGRMPGAFQKVAKKLMHDLDAPVRSGCFIKLVPDSY